MTWLQVAHKMNQLHPKSGHPTHPIPDAIRIAA